MPAETHQRGGATDAATVGELLLTLLDVDGTHPGDPDVPLRLQDCGVTMEDVDWLWQTVCEELAERSLSFELDPAALTPAMTVGEAAEVMAAALAAGGEDGG